MNQNKSRSAQIPLEIAGLVILQARCPSVIQRTAVISKLVSDVDENLLRVYIYVAPYVVNESETQNES